MASDPSANEGAERLIGAEVVFDAYDQGAVPRVGRTGPIRYLGVWAVMVQFS